MHTKTIAPPTGAAGLFSQKQHAKNTRRALAQRGVTLIELMVGITIGLVVVAVASSALMFSRTISGTVSDASDIQQQAAYAMRVIDLQLRQAGSLHLNLQPGTATAADPYLAPVAFEAGVLPGSNPPFDSFTPATDTLSGTTSPATVTVGYQRYTEPMFTSATPQALSRNCLGGPADTSTDQRLQSTFWLSSKNELRCAGNQSVSAPPLDTEGQPVVQNVANFQVRYLLQDNTSTPGTPTIKSVDASGVANWGQVQAVEVCLVLYGTEAIDLPAGSSYTDCDGTTTVDMTALPVDTATVKRRNRMHLVFRNVLQLRSQGLIGSVL